MIVFVTVSVDQIYDALGTNFIDYIVEPYEPNSIKKAIRKILNHSIVQNNSAKLKIKYNNISYIIEQKDILYVETMNRSVKIVTVTRNYTFGCMIYMRTY